MPVTVYTAGKEFSEIFKGETAQPVGFSREEVTVLADESLVMGAVVGKVTTTGKVVALTPAASDGSEKAHSVMIADCNATGADKQGVAMVRDAYINTINLVWPAGITDPQKVAALGELEAKGLIEKETV